MILRPWGLPLALAAIAGLSGTGDARTDYGHHLGRRVGDQVVYVSQGVPTYTQALEPTVQRRYLPASLYSENRHHQWEYTNYARDHYRRYVNSSLEGVPFYDGFGSLITRGWLIYDWRQVQPRIAESSHVFKASQYHRWFDRQLLAVDSKGDYSFSILVGDEINTTLTPMTFRKAGFNGVMANLATRRLRVTGLFSRISGPVITEDLGVLDPRVNATNLVAGRTEVDVAPGMTIGLNLVNSHVSNGTRESFEGNPLKGELSTGHLEDAVRSVLVRLSDDSPEDGRGGAVLIARDIEIRTRLSRPSPADPTVMVDRDTLIVGSSFGFSPRVQGGSVKNGLLVADGAETIVLDYVLAPADGESEEGSLRLLLQRRLGLSLAEAEDVIQAIENVRFRLVLANDYRVEMSSDRQTDRSGVPQFLLVTRAEGNVQNETNSRQVVFDYGLPTANLLYGISAELRDLRGVDFYGELNINSSYRKYPGRRSDSHRAIAGIDGDERAIGWLANLSWSRYPWSVFLEGFGMDDAYTTSVRPVPPSGVPNYSPEAVEQIYDFVEDNDDQDRQPDQKRFNQGTLVPPQVGEFDIDQTGVADPEVFPGYDENGDFISDFNQNNNPIRRNLLPDYDEPFLRYHSDRPEFLFGMDLNNNGWIDRFENDDLPDYPYKKDHWGYNGYSAYQLSPGARLSVGQLRQEKQRTGEENVTTYGILTAVEDLPGRGRIRVYDMLRLAEDEIPDPLSQWIMTTRDFGEPGNDSGRHVHVPDRLAAADTWINTFYADWKYDSPRRWSTFHRFKWETWRQRDADVEYLLDAAGDRVLVDDEPVVVSDPLGPEGRNGRRVSGFVGFIDKAEYRHLWRNLTISPKVKSEFLSQTPFALEARKQRSWDAVFSLQVRFPVLRTTRIEAGWEQRYFYDVLNSESAMDPGQRTGDFRGTVLALQLTNPTDYLGYRLITQIGMLYDRRTLERVGARGEKAASGLFYVSTLAGLE